MDTPLILVFRTGHLGDTLVTLPAFRAIRAAHETARIVLLTDLNSVKANAVTSWDVVGPLGVFDDVVYLPVPSRLSDFVAVARAIRGLNPARLYYLPSLPRSRQQVGRDWLFFRLGCGIHDIIGLRSTGRYPVRNRQGILVRIEPEHQRLFNWIAPALPPMTRPSGQTAIGAYERQYADTILGNAGFKSCTVIACGPGSKVQAARWPEDRFEAMGRELLRRRSDVRLVVLGSASEHPLGERLGSIWGDRAINLAGALTIWQSGALLERCALYVGNDTGTMHLAASVGTPCVTIFSARANPGQWEPEGNGHIVLRHEVPCAGCGLETCLEHDLACLKAITVDEVLRAADALLETPRDREPLARYQHA